MAQIRQRNIPLAAYLRHCGLLWGYIVFMSAQKKSTKQPSVFAPADEQSLTNEWLLTEDVMKMLRCSISTIKNLRSKKLLPYSKIGGLIYYNSTDVHQMLVTARRLSFVITMWLLWLGDFLEVIDLDGIG